jgi:hypothetical protein
MMNDPRIRRQIDPRTFLKFCFSAARSLDGINLNQRGFDALSQDVFFTLAELGIPRLYIEKVMVNVAKARKVV